ncbi:MAG: DUF2069 domain-containing protein [Gammaproteobacteria bacterium]|nr:DUF2069 domain-containing protein [Gammaproteobacteria bacterium]
MTEQSQNKSVHAPAEIPGSINAVYYLTVISYLIALSVFISGWYSSGRQVWGILLCVPLVLLIPGVIGKRRRYYQLIPNLLVIYIGWSLVERMIDNGMQTNAGIALFFWVMCLVLMLKLIRTPYLVDGRHYVADPEKKAKRLAKKQARAKKNQGG